METYVEESLSSAWPPKYLFLITSSKSEIILERREDVSDHWAGLLNALGFVKNIFLLFQCLDLLK